MPSVFEPVSGHQPDRVGERHRVTLLRLPSFMKTSHPRSSLSRTLAPRALWAASKHAVAPLLKRRQRGVRWAASCTGQRRRPSKPSADHLVRSDLAAAADGSYPAWWMSAHWHCRIGNAMTLETGVVMVVLGGAWRWGRERRARRLLQVQVCDCVLRCVMAI